MNIQPENIPALIDYRGWTIWAWTGWKSEKSVARFDRRPGCHVCGQDFIAGDVLWVSQGRDAEHWTCRHPDNRPAVLHAQWLAMKEENGKMRYCEANCADIVLDEIPAGEYRPGDCFEIVPNEWAITENDTDEKKDATKSRGLERLKALIDTLEIE